MKRILISFLLCSCLVFSAISQQMTRFAIVDVQRIILSYYKDSKEMRDYEDKKVSLQKDIDTMKTEITALRNKKVEADKALDKTLGEALDLEINKKTEALKLFFTTKNTELEEQRKKMLQSDTFKEAIAEEIKAYARTNGFNAVFDGKATPGLIWYDTSVEITDIIIKNLQAKAQKTNP